MQYAQTQTHNNCWSCCHFFSVVDAVRTFNVDAKCKLSIKMANKLPIMVSTTKRIAIECSLDMQCGTVVVEWRSSVNLRGSKNALKLNHITNKMCLTRAHANVTFIFMVPATMTTIYVYVCGYRSEQCMIPGTIDDHTTSLAYTYTHNTSTASFLRKCVCKTTEMKTMR